MTPVDASPGWALGAGLVAARGAKAPRCQDGSTLKGAKEREFCNIRLLPFVAFAPFAPFDAFGFSTRQKEG
jgi:hypothetical protein